MIPLPLAGLLSRFLQPFLFVALVATAIGCFYLGYRNNSLKAEVATLRADALAAIAKDEEEKRAIEHDAVEVQNQMRMQNANDLAAVNARLADAMRRLRDSESERAKLKAAAAAPAECREYAASPSQLSVQDAGFLTGEADRADRVAVQLRGCQRELAGVIEAVNRERE